jgi:hypothetical protein
MFPKRAVTSYVRPLSSPKEEEESVEVSSWLSSHLHTGVKTPSNSKIIPDWITSLQIPTKKDVTLICIGSGPGVRYKELAFPTKVWTFNTCRSMRSHAIFLKVKLLK